MHFSCIFWSYKIGLCSIVAEGWLSADTEAHTSVVTSQEEHISLHPIMIMQEIERFKRIFTIS